MAGFVEGYRTGAEIRRQNIILEQEMEALKAFRELNIQGKNEAQSRQQAIQWTSQLPDIIKLPKSFRGTHVDVLAGQAKDSGHPLSENVIKTLKSGSTEELQPLVKQLQNTLLENTNMDTKQLGDILGDPNTATALIGKANLLSQTTTGVGGVDQKKRLENQVSSLESKRDNFLRVANNFPNTKSGQAAFQRAKFFQSQIDKLTGKGEGSKAKLIQVKTTDAQGNKITMLADPQSGEPVKVYQGEPKLLTTGDVEKMSKVSTTFDMIDGLQASFKDEFGGYKSNIIGNIAIEAKKRLGDDTEVVEFWQSYQEQTNIIRKELFGTALTRNEQKEFEKARIFPGMDPKIIRANLERQRIAALKAAALKSRPFATGNYDRRQLEGALGPHAETILNVPLETERQRIMKRRAEKKTKVQKRKTKAAKGKLKNLSNEELLNAF